MGARARDGDGFDLTGDLAVKDRAQGSVVVLAHCPALRGPEELGKAEQSGGELHSDLGRIGKG